MGTLVKDIQSHDNEKNLIPIMPFWRLVKKITIFKNNNKVGWNNGVE